MKEKDIRNIVRGILNEIHFHKQKVKLGDLFVDGYNMDLAYTRAQDSMGEPSSMSTGKPLHVWEFEDGSLYLSDGHHRVADEIVKHDNIKDILDIELEAYVDSPEFHEKDLSYFDDEDIVSLQSWIYDTGDWVIDENKDLGEHYDFYPDFFDPQWNKSLSHYPYKTGHVDEDAVGYAKDKVKKVWQATKNTGQAIKREVKETRIAARIFMKLIKKQNPTPEEIKFLKSQSVDLLKAAGIMAAQLIPGSSIGLAGLEKLLNKYGLTAFPKAQS
jgi:hypothetical protein